ncbi:MAG: DEAD/DEAH box helicase [Pseudomonadota bacterium]|nr:DEAD/DEAH box helicase [Pseudomonadota bacterium]
MFSAAVDTWFRESFEGPTEVQRRGWAVTASGKHAMLVAPTGSGKTLAAFLAAIDGCLSLPADVPAGFRVVYVSPLKALVYDVERNLRAPLAGVRRVSERLGKVGREVRVDIRTGDTSRRERERQARDPGEILVTTPESLFLVLGSRSAGNLRRVTTVIVDEIHALASTKRGVHLAVTLERLSDLAEHDPQRIGLSATVQPLDEAKRWLGGDRTVEIVDASEPPRIELSVSMPVPDSEGLSMPSRAEGGSILGELYTRELTPKPQERGIWPAIYPQLVERIRAHRSTIVFVNSRGLCERLTQRVNELAGEELVRAHHGSVSHEKRAEIEDGLKRGRLKGIVATSSLELGIDMGSVDLVIQVESPGSVARGLQRVGRSGHGVGEISRGVILPKFRGDLLESTVIATRMLDAGIEALRVPRNCLDVLAQQVAAICMDTPHEVSAIGRLVRRAYPFRELGSDSLNAVLDMLTGNYPSQAFADLRPLLAWDRAADTLRPRRGTAMLVRMNAGTIPDRGNYAVQLGTDGPRLGELDEEMVFETRNGDTILLGASAWRVEDITRDRVVVSPAPGEPGKLPFWRGEGPGRPVELGRELGAFVRRLATMPEREAATWLQGNTPLDANGAVDLASYVAGQKAHDGAVPTDRSILVERFPDELGDWRICILSPFGARVHAPWAMALQQRLSVESGFEVQVMYTDDGIVLRFADVEDLPDLQTLLPDPDEIEELVTAQLPHTSLFAGLFRENAGRALLLTRRRPDQRTPLWAQRLKAQNLLAAARQFANFPMVLETFRQALSDVFDLGALQSVLRDIRSRRIRVHEVETRSASPFARSLVFAYVAAYIYEQDAPLAERKAQALTLDRELLRELLGQAELRELIDGDALAELERELQHLDVTRRARDQDEVHDLLRRLGHLDDQEIALRTTGDAHGFLAALAEESRAVRIRVAGRPYWIAVEDAALYRDTTGAVPPGGLPVVFLRTRPDALEELLRRFSRTHGPFRTRQAAERFGLRPAQVEPVLRLLERESALVRGEIRPGGVEPEWCDPEILRRIKRRTLARLRHQIAPADGVAFTHFLWDWHGLDSRRGGNPRLLEVVAQLEGLALPWSLLRDEVLPSRVAGFSVEMLDMLAAGGEVVWIGCGPLGARDGRIALYRRQTARRLLDPDAASGAELGEVHVAVVEHLRQRGACFMVELESAVRTGFPELTLAEWEAVIWDLVWAGGVTNDTFAPLCMLGAPRRRQGRRSGKHGLAGGRWWCLDELVDAGVTPTERTLARAETLLERYGILSREAAVAEALPGGFGALYPVLAGMEESGRVRRGYFIEGLGGAQFVRPGVIDRLRGLSSASDDGASEVRMLAAVDPANPWGALLPWPDAERKPPARATRVSGAWVIFVDGAPVLYLGANHRRLLTFPETTRDDQVLSAALRGLSDLPQRLRRGSLTIDRVDGEPVADSPIVPLMLQQGFRSDYRGMTVYRDYGVTRARG